MNERGLEVPLYEFRSACFALQLLEMQSISNKVHFFNFSESMRFSHKRQHRSDSDKLFPFDPTSISTEPPISKQDRCLALKLFERPRPKHI